MHRAHEGVKRRIESPFEKRFGVGRPTSGEPRQGNRKRLRGIKLRRGLKVKVPQHVAWGRQPGNGFDEVSPVSDQKRLQGLGKHLKGEELNPKTKGEPRDEKCRQEMSRAQRRGDSGPEDAKRRAGNRPQRARE